MHGHRISGHIMFFLSLNGLTLCKKSQILNIKRILGYYHKRVWKSLVRLSIPRSFIEFNEWWSEDQTRSFPRDIGVYFIFSSISLLLLLTRWRRNKDEPNQIHHGNECNHICVTCKTLLMLENVLCQACISLKHSSTSSNISFSINARSNWP